MNKALVSDTANKLNMNVKAIRKNTGRASLRTICHEIFEANISATNNAVHIERIKKFSAGNTADTINNSENNFALGSSL